MTSEPSINSFVQSMRWAVSQGVLKKFGVSQHKINLITNVLTPFKLSDPYADLSDRYNGTRALNRAVSFDRIGILCVSNSTPFLREITIRVEIPENSPILFGKETTLRAGFEGEEDKYGHGHLYEMRKDFSGLDKEEDKAQLFELPAGIVNYPFQLAGANTFHQRLNEKYQDRLFNDYFRFIEIHEDDLEALEQDYANFIRTLRVSVGMILDSGDLLAFHWSSENQCFEDNFYNSGVKHT